MYTNKQQSGNVLFLILIAVTLFAALSYAVTQSTRGGGNADSEKSQITLAEHTQIVSEMRVALQRMQLKGIDIADVNICDGGWQSGEICGRTRNSPCSTGAECLFSPEGGAFDSSRLNKWSYFMYEAPAGDTMAGHGTENIVFSLWGKYDSGSVYLTENECQQIQKSFGLSTTIEMEQTLDSIFADGTPLEGSWDFCMQAASGAAPYQTFHLLATN
jgi:hypothetical protein